MSKQLIVFCGNAGSGKSTLCEYLSEKYLYFRLKFADPIKEMLASIGLGYEELEGDLKEKPCDLLGGKTPRFAMQTLGTEWGRQAVYNNIWVDAWSRDAEELLLYRNVVCDDMRFPNEVEAVKKFNGTIIKIVRPGQEDIPENTHISEQNDLGYDHILVNNGTTTELFEKLEEIIK